MGINPSDARTTPEGAGVKNRWRTCEPQIDCGRLCDRLTGSRRGGPCFFCGREGGQSSSWETTGSRE